MPNRKSSLEAQRGRRLQRRLLIWGGVAALLFVSGLLLRFYLFSQPVPPPPAVEETALRQTRDITLYFAAMDGSRLVAEGRTINDCSEELDCVTATVQELIRGPVGDLSKTFPSHVELLGIEIDESLVTVDFGPGLVSGHPGGAESELFTVYALVDTLAANYPHLRQVRITVDGKPVETLKGHVDLRQPLTPDYSLVEEGESPVGDLSTLPTRSEE